MPDKTDGYLILIKIGAATDYLLDEAFRCINTAAHRDLAGVITFGKPVPFPHKLSRLGLSVPNLENLEEIQEIAESFDNAMLQAEHSEH